MPFHPTAPSLAYAPTLLTKHTGAAPPNGPSLFDGGATHFIHPTDYGALPGSWQRDVPGLHLGDKGFLRAYGSVEKLFLPPPGVDGDPVKRRVLIAPQVMCCVWSHPQEIDTYKSTFVDSPESTHLVLADGRRFPFKLLDNGLRMLNCRVAPSDESAAALLIAGIALPPPTPSRAHPLLAVLCTQRASDGVCAATYVSGVGKPRVQLTALESLRLWHHRLGHPSLRTLLVAIVQLRIDFPKLTSAALRAFKLEPCDWSNAFKQRRHAIRPGHVIPAHPARPVPHDSLERPRLTAQQLALGSPSPRRALRALRRVQLDVFGPVRVANAFNGYRYLVGFYDEATGMRWVFGSKDHTAETVERLCQVLRASLRIVLGEIEIIRTDNAREFAASARWAEYLADCGIFPEFSVPYSAYMIGGVERGWGVACPTAGIFIAKLGAGHRHWFPACRHAFFLACAMPSDVVTIDMKRQHSSAHQRIYGVEIQPHKLRCYSAPVRFVLDESQRDGKFSEHARAGKYIGVSPSNASAMWVYDGHNYITVGGQSVVDESMFISPLPAPAERFATWPDLSDEDTPEPTPASPTLPPSPPPPPPGLPSSASPTLPPSPPPPPPDLPSSRLRSRTAAIMAATADRSSGLLANGDSSAGDCVSHQSILSHGLRHRALLALVLASAATPDCLDAKAPETCTHGLPDVPTCLIAEAAACDAVSPHRHDPPDIVAAATSLDPAAVAHSDPAVFTHDVASRAAVACAHGAQPWATFGDVERSELRACVNVYAVSIDEFSNHPALVAAAATKTVKKERKTVVYQSPDGVVKAIEPKSIAEALASLQRDQWVNAVHVELDNLKSHSAFHLVPESEPLGRGKKIMRTTYVFKIKVNEDMTLEKYKARLCVVGSSMEQGSDYWESYAACARTTSVKLVLVTTTVAGWIDFHFDLHGAFLTADIDTDVYTYQPHGIDQERGPNGERMVWKLDKAIYGTVQAARLFTHKLRDALFAIGFEASMDDDNVYRLDHKLGRIILSTHIDDGIGGASSQAVLDYFYAELEKAGFKFSAPPGPWKTVLGFGVTRDHARRTVKITANKQISALVHEHLASEAQVPHPRTPDAEEVMTLEPPSPDETKEQSDAAEKAFRGKARALKGGLIYIGQIHPAIVHAVSRVCSLMAKPTARSYACAKRILAWLDAHKETGVVYGGPNITCLADLAPRGPAQLPMDSRRDASLACCCDSDLSRKTLPASAGVPGPPDHASARSQLGYEISVAGGCLDAISRRQASVAVDVAAAELFAASAAAAHLITVTGVYFFITFGVLGHHPVPLWCDNEACVLVTKDASSLKRLAYVTRRVRLLQELQHRRVINISNVPGKANPADPLTKHVDKLSFRSYMARLYNVDPTTF